MARKMETKPNIKNLRKNQDVKGIVNALKYSDWQVRRDAADALGKLAEKRTPATALKEAVAPLATSLKDANTKVRVAAANTFGTWGIYRIMDNQDISLVEAALTEALKDEDRNAAWVAASSLAVIPISVKLEEAETIVRQLEKINLEAFAPSTALLLLTTQRLIFNAVRVAGSLAYELKLTDIISCEVKKPFFGNKKLVVTSQKATLKQRLQLETGIGEGARTTYRWKQVGPHTLTDPKPAVFTGIKQTETIQTEIKAQIEHARAKNSSGLPK